jgi:hypothetical protein
VDMWLESHVRGVFAAQAVKYRIIGQHVGRMVFEVTGALTGGTQAGPFLLLSITLPAQRRCRHNPTWTYPLLSLPPSLLGCAAIPGTALEGSIAVFSGLAGAALRRLLGVRHWVHPRAHTVQGLLCGCSHCGQAVTGTAQAFLQITLLVHS